MLRELIQSASSPHVGNTTVSIPSIQLPDISGATLSCLLTFILPVLPVLPSTIEQTMLLLSVAQKYQMHPILTQIRGTIASQDPPFIRLETAFRIYSLAQTYGLRQETFQAACATLTFPFTVESLGDELGAISGAHLHELWKYYQRVKIHLTSDLTAFSTGDATLNDLSCTQTCSLTWLRAYIVSIAESPARFDLTEFHMCSSRHIRDVLCRCATIPNKTVEAFWRALAGVVHSCMTKVSVSGLRNCMVPSNSQNTSIGRIRYLGLRRTSN